MNRIKNKTTPKRSQFGQATVFKRSLKNETNKETEELLAPMDNLITYVRKLDIKLKETERFNSELKEEINTILEENEELENKIVLRDMDLLHKDNQIHNLKLEIEHLKQGFRNLKDVIEKTPYANEPPQEWGAADEEKW